MNAFQAFITPDVASVFCACSIVPAAGLNPEDSQIEALLVMSSTFGHHDRHGGQRACHLYNQEDVEYV